MNVSLNSISSSALPMLDRQLRSSPRSATVGTESAPVDRLDALVRAQVAAARNPFLKIDTQGFEKPVLVGAGAMLQDFVGVEMEMSIVALYDGQMLFREAIDFMEDRGFHLAGLSRGFWDKQTGETLQVDGTFIRSEQDSRSLQEAHSARDDEDGQGQG